MVRAAWLTCLFLSTSVAASALDGEKALSQFGHRVWTRDQGLPQDSIRSITQAADGALWVGTEEGLARFDGTEFLVFGRAADGLANATITALLGTRDGAVYVGTLDGLFRYRDGQFRSFASAVVRGRVSGLVEDRDGVTWLVADARLFAVRGDDVRDVSGAVGLSQGAGWQLRLSRLGDLLVIGDGEAARWQGDGFVELPVIRAPFDAPGASPRRADHERIWVWDGDSVRGLIDAGTAMQVDIAWSGGLVRAVLHDRDGTVWVGTGDGLLRGVDAAPTPVSAPDFSAQAVVWALYEDRDGTLWVGTNAGLHEFRDLRVAVFGRSEGWPSDQPTVVHQHDDGALWIGFENAGVVRKANGRLRHLTTRDGLPSAQVFSIRATASGDLLVATSGGLARIRGGALPRVEAVAYAGVHGTVFDALEGPEGRLIVAADSGLFVVEGDRVTRAIAAGPGLADAPTTLARAPDGAIWAGTHGDGLYRYHDGAVRHFTVRDGLASNAIRALYADPSGILWIGTLGGGLAWWQDGVFGALPLQPSQSANVGQIVAGRDQTLWLGTSTGIVQIDGAAALAGAEDATRDRVSGLADGLRSSQATPAFPTARGGTVDGNGRLWMITANGLARLDPQRRPPSPRPRATVIRRVFVNGEPIEPSGDLDLPPHVQRVTFAFSSIYLYAPERVRYRYRLEGYDPDWVDGGARRAADYTNLPPGSYTFVVVAEVGNDEAEPARLAVTQRAAWYASAWFPWLVVVGAVATAGVAYGWRLRQLRTRFGLVLAERGRISRELHDTLAQGLVGISTQLHGVAASLRDAPAMAEQRLHLARRMVQHSLTEARRTIMDLRDPVLDGRSLKQAIEHVTRQSTAGSGIDVVVAGVDEPPGLSPQAREHVLRIAQEAVHNAVKHGAPRRVQVALAADGPLLVVQDDGRGHDVQAMARAVDEGQFGLLGMQERARLIGATLRIDSTPGAGTRIVVERAP